MSHSRFTRMPGLLAAAMAASFCAVAQAGPEKTIFAAENALYGAGYEIGKADGWMDDTLRSAIREYQSRHSDLQATGNLDADTLSALGVALGSGGTISENAVPDRKAALAAVGLEERRFQSSSNNSAAADTVVAEPQPEAVPEPAAEQPAPEIPEADPATTIALASDDNSQPEPQPSEIAEPARNDAVEQRAEEPVPEPEVAAPSESEQAESPDTAEATVQPAEPEPEVAEEVITVEEQTEPAAVEVTAVEQPADIESELPEEPTGAGKPEMSATAQAPESSSGEASQSSTTGNSSGGFFSAIFDFLFGWLI